MQDQDLHQVRAQLVELLSAADLDAILQDLVTDKELSRFRAARQRLSGGKLAVAVLGRQGVGKSTLLNALVGRRLLPMDETETTNVICTLEGTTEKERAVVRFADGREETGPISDDFLRQYTDEQLNPGNEKRVEAVACYLRSPLLDTGVQLVDTPGVGSLTPSTERVTRDYLKNVSLGLFLISTAPTLLDSESLFLRTTWEFSRSFVFVQNAWASSQQEVVDAEKENLKKLREIAKEEGGDDSVLLKIVDVHRGLEGQRNARPDHVEQSGLSDLILALRERLSKGAGRALVLAEGHTAQVALQAALSSVRLRLASLAKEGTEDEGAFLNRQREAREKLDALEDEWRAALKTFRGAYDEIFGRFQEAVEIRVSEVEDAITSLIESRKLDATKVNAAFEEKLQVSLRAPLLTLQREFGAAVKEVVDEATRIAAEASSVAVVAVGFKSTAEDLLWIERKETLGRGLGYIGGAGVALFGGMALWAAGAALIAGETVAAAAAAAAAAVPGVGWAVAAGVLIAGYTIRELHKREAVKTLLRAVHRGATETRRKLVRRTKEDLKEKASEVEQTLDTGLRAQISQQRRVLEDLERDRRKKGAQRESVVQRLQGSEGVVTEALRAIGDTLGGVAGRSARG